MVKLIAVDMDGTFFDDEKRKSPEFGKVFNVLKNRGIHFCAASGRQMASLKKEFAEYSDDIIFVSENGTVVELDGKIILEEKLDEDITSRILGKFNKMSDKKAVYCTKDYSYINDMDDASKKNAEIFLPKHKVVKRFEDIDRLPVKISIYSEKGFDRDFQSIFDEFSDVATVCTSAHGWLDIMSKNSSKGNAIKKLQGILDITSKETMAFGDQMNDFDMLNDAYYSYAMENAVDEIKKISRFIAPSNNEYGVIKVLKEFFNIK
ncbi:Cof-type HAD-IIB family hydrolase [Peptostreptococcus faecalis]|uniref:Cof-type HAD-IIB family hydrolase n=1 Tax=Peptostreptococcus faecalis TaxID=2045015 RepID=UPI000C7B5234|nr:HAD family hydrolase [Peptostreptococcus faecalis]